MLTTSLEIADRLAHGYRGFELTEYEVGLTYLSLMADVVSDGSIAYCSARLRHDRHEKHGRVDGLGPT
jgi:hypothetical protein